MKHLYKIDLDKFYYIRSWGAYCALSDLLDKPIYTQAFSKPQAILQIRARIAEITHFPISDIDIYSRDVEYIENEKTNEKD